MYFDELRKEVIKMMNYEEMRKEFVKKVAKIQNWSQDDWDFLNEEYEPKLENGVSLSEGMGTAFDETVYDEKYHPHIITIIAYDEPIFDEDGDISDYKRIGYDFEF